eukprot:GEMP01032412.1.p1 GENE.GEMP01032412.1~~GEMP01032412.1.p1  ORF type:complete len:496 (+),score=87.60 GEMP01032412.1:101-1588(+)
MIQRMAEQSPPELPTGTPSGKLSNSPKLSPQSAKTPSTISPQSHSPLLTLPFQWADFREMNAKLHERFPLSMNTRAEALEALLALLKNNQKALKEAIYQDLRRPEELTDRVIAGCIASTSLALDKFREWSQPIPQRTPKVGPCAGSHSETRYVGRGPVLIIGTWNFPIPLTVKPLASALAAGCPVCLKLSEISVHTSALLHQLFVKYLSNFGVVVVFGSIPETTALLDQRWGTIFYTGNTEVAKIVMRAASAHLTPCILECGGKNPVFILEDANIEIAAKKVADARLQNCGQFCVAPDYVLCPTSLAPAFVESVCNHIRAFFGDNPAQSASYGRIVNKAHTERLLDLLVDHGGMVVIGGHGDAEEHYLEPTVVANPRWDSKLMENEIFGPILPILTYDDLDETIAKVNLRPNPLSCYVFGELKSANHVVNSTYSGGASINDCCVHMLNETLPFGGNGASGHGSYHGEWGFRAFSHEKAVVRFDTKHDPVQRFAPY